MSRGGRGFSPRGSFRGRGESSWNSGSSRGRGTFTGPSRGRFNWFKENSSSHFDSRRYSGSSSGERYSTRGRGEDASYRRYGRTEVPSYSSRDRSHHRSPDSSHKRMRTDSYGSQASSSRRSHEGNYGSGNDYNNRYSYSEDKGSGYAEERVRYRDDRRTSGGGGFRDRSRDDYSHRKPDHLSMPPPSARHLPSTRPRGTFRGRFSFRGTRGYTRISLARRTDALLARKRAIADSYVIRKRILTAKIQADSLKRLKIQKLRRMKEAALIKKAEKIQKALKATEDISDDDAKEEDEEDEDEGEEKEKMDDDELEEGETVEKKEKTKVKKVKTVKKTKKAKPVEEREEGEEVDEEEDPDEEDPDEEDDDADEKDDDLKGESGVQVTIKHDSDKRDVSEDVRRWQPGFRRQFIKLSCPHCYYRCVTFKEYSMHMYSPKHVGAMRRLSLHHKQRLVCMRLTQRQKQRVLEETEEEDGTLTSRTNFCHVCKLNYRQQKVQHMMSESHQSMKKFLLPYCRICRIAFKSPMLYENHACSLDHIKRKARMEERVMRLKNEENGSGSDIDGDEKEVDLENFMILDSVGDADAEADGDENMEEGSDGKEKADGEDAEKTKKEVNLGSEFVRKLEVLFCELCNMYLPRLDNQDRAMAIHCRNRGHLQRYVHYRDDRSLRKKAESLHRKEAERAEAKKASEEKKKEEEASKNDETIEKIEIKTEPEADKEEEGENKEEESTAKEKKVGNADKQDLVSDETLWADVDNLIVLADRDDCAHENKSSDEDEEGGDRGRYDRFGTSSKKATLVKPSSEPDMVVLEPEETASSEKDEPSSQADEESIEKMVVEAEDEADTTVPAEDPVSITVE